MLVRPASELPSPTLEIKEYQREKPAELQCPTFSEGVAIIEHYGVHEYY